MSFLTVRHGNPLPQFGTRLFVFFSVFSFLCFLIDWQLLDWQLQSVVSNRGFRGWGWRCGFFFFFYVLLVLMVLTMMAYCFVLYTLCCPER